MHNQTRPDQTRPDQSQIDYRRIEAAITYIAVHYRDAPTLDEVAAAAIFARCHRLDPYKHVMQTAGP